MPAGLDLTGLVLPTTVEEATRSDDDRRAEYVLQPLERGFGHTVGNSVRRVLLSSLPGAAVWAFRADGVQHEHQTMANVGEDVHQIIQNLKRVVLILDEGTDEAKLELTVHKAGPVRASDVTPHAGVQIVNPDHVLFTLQEDLPEDRPLHAHLWVNRGRGFVQAEQHPKPDDAPVDLIRVDSIYNPVLRANFVVQETRVGQRTDFDRLTLRIETNGSLDPAEAVAYAAEVAKAHLDYLTRFGSVSVRASGDGAGDAVAYEEVGDDLRGLLAQPLDSFDQISSRSRNALIQADIHTLGDVASRTRDEMLGVSNFGEKSLEEVAEVLALNGLRFGMRFDTDEHGRLLVHEDHAGGAGVGGNGAGGDGATGHEDADEA